jgi:hypothetical protein
MQKLHYYLLLQSLLENLFFKYIGFDQELACPECGSLQMEFIEFEKDKLKQVCQKCEHEEILNLEEQ